MIMMVTAIVMIKTITTATTPPMIATELSEPDGNTLVLSLRTRTKAVRKDTKTIITSDKYLAL